MARDVRTPAAHLTRSGFGFLTSKPNAIWTSTNQADHMRALIIGLEAPTPKRITSIDFSFWGFYAGIASPNTSYRSVRIGCKLAIIRNMTIGQALLVKDFDPIFTENSNGLFNANTTGNNWGKKFEWADADIVWSVMPNLEEAWSMPLNLQLSSEPHIVVMTPVYMMDIMRTIVVGDPNSGYQHVGCYIGTTCATVTNQDRTFTWRDLNVNGEFC